MAEDGGVGFDAEEVDCAEADGMVNDVTRRPASNKRCFMNVMKKIVDANHLKNSSKTLRNPFFENFLVGAIAF